MSWLKKLQEAYSLTEIEPTMPKGGLVGGDYDVATGMIEYFFSTSMGNKVVVSMDYEGQNPEEADRCAIAFTVNGTYDDADRSSKERDPEILNGVLGAIKEHMRTHNLQAFSFSAWSGDSDQKNRKVGEEVVLQKVALKAMDEYLAGVGGYFDSSEFGNYLKNINLKERLSRLHGFLLTKIDKVVESEVDKIELLIKDVVKSMRGKSEKVGGADVEVFGKAIMDYIESLRQSMAVNVSKVSNRRASLYQKIIQRFLPGWTVEQHSQYPNMFLIKRGR